VKRPALDYFGGKWKHAGRIIETFPLHKTFVDVFCGAASITLRKPRSKNEIINDANDELINFFSILRDRNLELRLALEKTPYGRCEYYTCREPSPDPVEQARRTVVKSWFGIGDSLDNETGFRVSLSQSGSTTAPWLTYVDYLHLYANRLRGVIIEHLDFAECIQRYDRPDTLFYLDPPYVNETRSKKHAYKHDWEGGDHARLLNLLPSIQGKFVLSAYEHESYAQLPYRKQTFSATSQQGERTEVLWIKEGA
jgi:DNA adenine methylase